MDNKKSDTERTEEDKAHVQRAFVQPLEDLARAKITLDLYQWCEHIKSFQLYQRPAKIKVYVYTGIYSEIHIGPYEERSKLMFQSFDPSLLEKIRGYPEMTELRIPGDRCISYFLHKESRTVPKPNEQIDLEDYEALMKKLRDL